MADEVNYCYRCGRRLGPQAGKCIYCSAPANREVRPPRRCPFCDQPVRHKAIKCHHCGERLDGSGKALDTLDVKPPPPGPTIVIEKAVFQGDPRFGGQGGGHAALEPPEGGRLLSPREIRALPSPEMPSAAGYSAPPASGRELAIPARGRDGDAPGGSSRGAGSAKDRELAVIDVESGPAGAASLPAKIGAAVGPKLVNVVKKGFGIRAKREEILEVRAEDEEARYRTCQICGTEILALDNYCFHCGQRYRRTVLNRDRPRGKPNSTLYAGAAAGVAFHMFGAGWGTGLSPETLQMAQMAAGAAAPVLAIWAFFRARGVVDRLIPIGVLIVSAALLIYF